MKDKYPNTTIKQPHISKRQQKRERKACRQREMDQLSKVGLISAKPVNVPETIPVKQISKEQLEKEEKIRTWMDINYLKTLANPSKKHFTYGLGNSPISDFDKIKTEFCTANDKNPRSFESWHNKAKFITMTPNGHRILEYPPVTKKSSASGMKRLSLVEAEKITNAKNNKNIEIIDIRWAGKEEDNSINLKKNLK